MTNKTRLLLVRHGETTANMERRLTGWVDSPLSERGVRQAKAAGRAVAVEAPLAAIYTSDLRRACDTAQVIAEVAGYRHDDIQRTADLREHSHGVFDGLTLAEAEARYADVWRTLVRGEWESVAPQGESNAAVAGRVARVLETALRANQGGTIVVVSHLLTIGHILRLLMEIPNDAHSRVAFTIANGGIHRLVLRNNRTWWIEALNDTSHLASVQ